MSPPAFVPSVNALPLKPGLSHVCGSGVSGATSTRVQARAHRPVVQPRFRMSAGRKFFVGGNWKCNLSKGAIGDLVAAFNAAPPLDARAVQVVIAPPALYLESTRERLRGDFEVSAQNGWLSGGGAYTGEVHAGMIKDVGGDWVILGHSERRNIVEIAETDATVAKKTTYALEQGLSVIFCVGELLEQREAGESVRVCERQLSALEKVMSSTADWSGVVIAYEPVWAIGTGKVASPEQAEEVHVAIRSWLRKNVSSKVADETRIVYGGSVSGGNCNELAKQSNIDGFLVGGASMKADFLDIVQAYKVGVAGAV